jgi:hypothetical protein
MAMAMCTLQAVVLHSASQAAHKLGLPEPSCVPVVFLQVTPAWGYDLTVALQQVSGLPVAGHPFLLIRLHLGSREEQYRQVAC